MIELDRRRFLQVAGSASLLSAVGGRLGWAASRPGAAKFAYIGTEHAIHVYSIDERLVERQTVPSARPVAMAISRGRLYVANGVSQYGYLPRGIVEAYAMDAVTGRLELLSRMPLSLSAISPRDLAVAPNGRSVVVAAHGGGAYNVFPLDEDGRLESVSGILKEIGSGPHSLQASAHPAAVVFDREGRVLAADQGSDTLSVFAISNGELSASSRCEVSAGSGPCGMVLHPDGRRVYVAHALNGSVSSFAYQATGILDCKQTVWASDMSDVAELAIHPSGEVLYSSHGHELRTWKIAANGGLDVLQAIKGVQAHKLNVTADGDRLLVLSSDAVLSMKIDAATRIPAAPVKVASLSDPLSIAVV
jgi:6-phosphogluconolactonase